MRTSLPHPPLLAFDLYQTACRVSPAVLFEIIVRKHAKRCALQIVELSVANRPDEREQPGQAQTQRQRHEIDEDVHGRTATARGTSFDAATAARGIRRSRKALSVTRIEEPDIAAAAINGVTKPAIATGTAIAL